MENVLWCVTLASSRVRTSWGWSVRSPQGGVHVGAEPALIAGRGDHLTQGCQADPTKGRLAAGFDQSAV